MTTRDEVEASIQASAEHEAKLGHTLRDMGYYAVPSNSGYRIPFGYFDGFTDRTLNVYVLPWSRGWSIFVSEKLGLGVYNWRDVEPVYKHMQRPLYAPRYSTGSYHVPVTSIVEAVHRVWHLLIQHTEPIAKRRAKQHQADTALINQAFERKLHERIARAKVQPLRRP